MSKRYFSDMSRYKTFEERFKYVMLNGVVGDLKFNGYRYLNQLLYHCQEWQTTRKKIIMRDNGYDLGCEDHPINGKILVHHLNPISVEDVVERRPIIFDPENLITVSFETHNAIHYGDESILHKYDFVERKPNDTIPWRR